MSYLRAPGALIAALVLTSALAHPAWAVDSVDPNAPVRDHLINFKDVPSLIKNPTFVTLKVTNADVRDMLRMIASKGGMNLILDDSVRGRIQVLDVKAMPLDEFFSLMLRTNKLAARRVGTSLLVATEAAIKDKIDDSQAATFRLNNATAIDAVKLLAGVLGKGGNATITPDDRTNSLLVTGNSGDLAKIKSAIEAIDVETPQLVIDVKLIEVSTNAARSLGGQFGFGGSKFGFSNNVTNPDITSNGQPSAGNPSSGSGTSITFSAMGNVTANLNARIDALVKNGEGTVLANPRIATQDSQEATIKLVDQEPILKTEFAAGGAGGGGLASESVTFLDIGETLKIRPRVDRKGFVTMDIEPTISEKTGTVIVNKNPVPTISTRTLKTKMRVADGESVVIGGLVRRTANKSTSKMPILGDLPVLGFLFKQESNSFSESEVIIVVTPHITTERNTRL